MSRRLRGLPPRRRSNHVPNDQGGVDRIVFIQKWPGRPDYHVYLSVAWDGPFLGDVRRLDDGRWVAIAPEGLLDIRETDGRIGGLISGFAATRWEAARWLHLRRRIKEGTA